MKILLAMDKGQQGDEKWEEVVGARYMVDMYGQSATIHGVSKVAAPQIYSFRRYIWMTLLVGMAIGLSIVVYLQFQRFSEHPTVTMVNAEFHDELNFPAVTICNINQYYRSRLPPDPELHTLLYNLSEFAELKGYLDMVDRNLANSPLPDYTIAEYIYQSVMDAAHRLDEMFLMCTWRGQKIDCADVFEKVVTDIGVCFQFNGNNSTHMKSMDTGPMGGLRVLLDIQQNQSFFSGSSQSGVKVLLSEPDEAPILKNAGWFVRPGTSTAIGIRKEELVGLGNPYKAFGTSYCYDTEQPDFVTPLKRYSEYSYTRNTCRKECFLSFLSKKCGCRHFFTPGKEAICTFDQFETCLIKAMRDEVLGNLTAMCRICPSPCHTVGYIPSISSADFASTFIIDYMVSTDIIKDRDYISNNVIDLRIFYDTLTVTKIQQKPELTVQGIIADLGGLMGMFLGASLLSLTELLELVALLVLGIYHKRQRRTSNSSEPIADDTKLHKIPA